MALVEVPGAGMWMPSIPGHLNALSHFAASDTIVDVQDEEVQIIYSVKTPGALTKTFGTSGSAIGWSTGASTAFATGATLRVGVKQSSKVDLTAGPFARATPGAAAFDVYRDLVGGTDALASTAWRTDAMAAGTPFAVAHGALLAVCHHLSVTSGSPSVKIRGGTTANAALFPSQVLVTAGPTFAATSRLPNVILTFDDGTIGWGEPTYCFSTVDVAGPIIGTGNIAANVFRVPFPCAIDLVQATMLASVNTADFALALYSDPLGTPVLMAEIVHDANVLSAVAASRVVSRLFTTPPVLDTNTDYALGIRPTGTGDVRGHQYDVAHPTYFRPNGLDETCYAAISTAGAAFVAQNSGMRRYLIWARVSHLSDGVGVGGGGGLIGRSLIAGAS